MATAGAKGRKGTVLVVDDQDVGRRRLRSALQDAGYAVIETTTADDAAASLDRAVNGVVLAGGVSGDDVRSLLPLIAGRSPNAHVVVHADTAVDNVPDAVPRIPRDKPFRVARILREAPTAAELASPLPAGFDVDPHRVTDEWGRSSSHPLPDGADSIASLVVAAAAGMPPAEPAVAAAAQELLDNGASVAEATDLLASLREVAARHLVATLGDDAALDPLRSVNRVLDRIVTVAVTLGTSRLERDALVDPLTGLGNRRALDRDLRRAATHATRYNRDLSVIVLDVNGLKRTNDRFGHEAGDELLRRIASELAGVLRGGDAAYRMGGDEFVAVLPDTDQPGVGRVIERLQESGTPSFKWGAATYPLDNDAHALLALADRRSLAAPDASTRTIDLTDRASTTIDLTEQRVTAGERRRGAEGAGAASGPPAAVPAAVATTAVTIDDDPAAGDAAEPAPVRSAGRWAERTVAARVLHVAIVAVPVIAGIVAAVVASHLLPRPDTVLTAVVWFATLFAISSGTMWLVDRAAQRFLPLAALLRLSMVFPDRAPSRFAVALRSGSVSRLRERLAAVDNPAAESDEVAAASTILSLVGALGAYDRRTRGHSERVRAYADLVADELELSDDDRDRLRWSALLHDIGKLEVPHHTLNKQDTLTEDEWEVIRRHPTEGARLALPLRGWLGDWADTIEQHHERWDGTGYPAGVAGEDICYGARIVAVADAFEVMTSVRSYRTPVSAVDARSELARCAGREFDPEVVRAFLRISLGDLRRVAGIAAWIGQLPFIGPLQPVSRQARDRAGGLAGAMAGSAVALSLAVAAGGVPVGLARNSHNDDLASGPQGNQGGGQAGQGSSPSAPAAGGRRTPPPTKGGSTPAGGSSPTTAPGSAPPAPAAAAAGTAPAVGTRPATTTGRISQPRVVGHGVAGPIYQVPVPSPRTPVRFITPPPTTPPVTTPPTNRPPVVTPPVTNPPPVVTPPVTNPPPAIIPGPVVTPPPVVTPAAQIVAMDDVAFTSADQAVKIYVTANDRAVHGFDKKSLRVIGFSGRGRPDPHPDQFMIEYHPNNASLGPQTVTYQICDTVGACDTATVTITVTPASKTKKVKVAAVQPAVVQPAVVQPAVVQPAVVQPAPVQPLAGNRKPAEPLTPANPHEHGHKGRNVAPPQNSEA